MTKTKDINPKRPFEGVIDFLENMGITPDMKIKVTLDNGKCSVHAFKGSNINPIHPITHKVEFNDNYTEYQQFKPAINIEDRNEQIMELRSTGTSVLAMTKIFNLSRAHIYRIIANYKKELLYNCVK